MKMKFRLRFEAAHRFTGTASPKCQTPHGHTWWVELTLRGTVLNGDSMLLEFQKFKEPWREFIEVMDHSFLHHMSDPLLPAFKDFIPNFRGLPFPSDPTTEVIASLMLRKAQHILESCLAQHQVSGITVHSLLLEETPTNHIEVESTDALVLHLIEQNKGRQAWWETADPKSRSLQDA